MACYTSGRTKDYSSHGLFPPTPATHFFLLCPTSWRLYNPATSYQLVMNTGAVRVILTSKPGHWLSLHLERLSTGLGGYQLSFICLLTAELCYFRTLQRVNEQVQLLNPLLETHTKGKRNTKQGPPGPHGLNSSWNFPLSPL